MCTVVYQSPHWSKVMLVRLTGVFRVSVGVTVNSYLSVLVAC